MKFYLIFYQKEYNNINLEKLEKIFELNKDEIKKFVNDMILDAELKDKWKKNMLNIIFDDKKQF